MTEVTENVTEVTKHGFGTKYMAMYGRVWLLWPCIAVYRRILKYIAVYCSISQHIAVFCSMSHFLAVIDPNSFGLVYFVEDAQELRSLHLKQRIDWVSCY